jgi:hypothetical protein
VTGAERDALLSGSIFASGNVARRRGQVCAVVGRTVFDEEPGAVDLLLRMWGGEAIYWAHERAALAERIRALGKPSIVVINLRLTGHSQHTRPFSSAFEALRRATRAVNTTGTIGYHRTEFR